MSRNTTCQPGLTALLLRVGLAIVFTYAALASLVNPNEWIGYLPGFLTDRFSADILLKFFSVYELALAVWLLTGCYVRYAAFLSAATLTGIVLANLTVFIVTFRDIALVFTALALAATTFHEHK